MIDIPDSRMSYKEIQMKRRLIRAIPEHGYEVEVTRPDKSVVIEVIPIDKTKMRVKRDTHYEINIGGSWWLATKEEFDAA